MTEARDGVAVCHATLHLAGVQPASFGPRLDGAADAVTGGKAVALDSDDPEVPRQGRQRVYALVGPCNEPAEQGVGMVVRAAGVERAAANGRAEDRRDLGLDESVTRWRGPIKRSAAPIRQSLHRLRMGGRL